MNDTHLIVEQAHRDVADRTQARADQAHQRVWLWAFGALGALVIGALVLWPSGTFGSRLQVAVQGVCAQQHFVLFGEQRLPLCARNTGIYAGFLATLGYLLAIGRGRTAKLPPWSIVGFLSAAVAVMGVDGLNSFARDLGNYNLYLPQNELRIATGLGMGIALAVFGLLVFNISLRTNGQWEQRVLGSWLELAGAIATSAVLYVVIWLTPGWLYLPLALFSVLGIVGMLWASNMFVVAMITGHEGHVRALRQLAQPATIGLVLVVGELALLAWLRHLMEQSLQIVG
jgi:uncharacterized membrane protein